MIRGWVVGPGAFHSPEIKIKINPCGSYFLDQRTNATMLSLNDPDVLRRDLTARQPRTRDLTPRSSTGIRPGSPLKQEIASSVESSSIDYLPARRSSSSSPTLSRDTRAYDQTHRWTVLTREAEADEVSIFSVTSEEKFYYAALFPDEGSPQVNNQRTSNRYSGFSEGVLIEKDEYEYNNLPTEPEKEDNVERFSEIEFEGEEFPETTNAPPPLPFVPQPPPDPVGYFPFPSLPPSPTFVF